MAAALPKNSSEEQQKSNPGASDYQARVKALAPLLAANAREIDERRELPKEIIDRMVDEGFFRLLLPKSLGGAELLPAQYVPIIEAFAEVDASTAWCLNQNSGCSMTAAYLSEEVAKEIFGGPRSILAWGPGPGEARVVAGGYNVTAQWAFASGSHHASWLGCHVPVIEANGEPRLESDGTPAVRTLFFPEAEDQVHRYLAHDGAARHRQRPIFGQGSVRAGGLFAALDRAQHAGAAARKGPDLFVLQPVDVRRRVRRGGDRLRARDHRLVHRIGARQDSARRPSHDAQQPRDPAPGGAGRRCGSTRPGVISSARSRTSPRRSGSAATSPWTSAWRSASTRPIASTPRWT